MLKQAARCRFASVVAMRIVASQQGAMLSTHATILNLTSGCKAIAHVHLLQ